MIRHGLVAIETEVPGRGAVTVETLHAGDVLGWSWLLPPYRSAFGARALATTRVLAIDGACLRGKCDAEPALGYDLLKVHGGGVRRAPAGHAAAAARPLRERRMAAIADGRALAARAAAGALAAAGDARHVDDRGRVRRRATRPASSRCSTPSAPARRRSRSAASASANAHTIRAVGAVTEALCARRRRGRARPVRQRVAARRGGRPRRRGRRGRHRPRAAAAGRRRAAGRARALRRGQRSSTAAARPPSCSTRTSSSAGATSSTSRSPSTRRCPAGAARSASSRS